MESASATLTDVSLLKDKMLLELLALMSNALNSLPIRLDHSHLWSQ